MEEPDLAARVKGWFVQMRDPQMQRSAAHALAALGPAEHGAVATLVGELDDTSSPCRWLAARTLGQIGAGAAAAGPALLRGLDDESNGLRQHAALALGRIGGADDGADVRLRELLAASAPIVRAAAASALLRRAPPALDAIEVLCQLRRGADVAVRSWAADGLIDAASSVAEARAAVITLLDDQDHEIREGAALGLAGCHLGEVVPALLAALPDGSDELRAGVLHALRGLGPRAHPQRAAIVGALRAIDAFGAPHQSTRRLAADLAGAVPLEDRYVIDALTRLLGDEDAWIRERAAAALLKVTASHM